MAQLLFLQSESNKKPIHMYINSPGGSVTAGLGVYDTMQYVLPPIATWCVGQACSMASLLLCAGTPGMRYSLPNARIMIHQPSGAAQVLYRAKYGTLLKCLLCLSRHSKRQCISRMLMPFLMHLDIEVFTFRAKLLIFKFMLKKF